MRDRWDYSDFRRMARGELLFTEPESATMRAMLQRRERDLADVNRAFSVPRDPLPCSAPTPISPFSERSSDHIPGEVRDCPQLAGKRPTRESGATGPKSRSAKLRPYHALSGQSSGRWSEALLAPLQQTAPHPRPKGQSLPPSLLIFGMTCRTLGRAHGR